jgi:formylglycine-generating enzyme required for sulfatase activity
MKKIISLLLLIICMQYANANNIEVSNVSLVNAGAQGQYIKFDVKWDNSWRVNTGQANYDGAYLFFKYKKANGVWRYINCKTTTSPLNILPAGFDVASTMKGLFVYRNSTNTGVGNVNITNSQLGIELSLIPTIAAIPYNVELRAYAVEMVYIPDLNSGSAFFGDGDVTNESTYSIHLKNTNRSGSITTPFLTDFNVDAGFDDALVTSPNFFSIGYFGTTYNGLGLSGGTIYPYFPTLGKVWCMKYEITQGAYRDFLNTLTLVQQATRTANVPSSVIGTGALTTSGSNRNFLEISNPSTAGVPAMYGCDASGNNVYDEPTDGEFVACNYLSWPDIAAWLDWSGLAPMTEIQYERICRGHTDAVEGNESILGEYAWGTNTINGTAGTIANPFAATEIVSNSNAVFGNGNYNSLAATGPLRNGIFATATSNRVTSGSSFFGVMDMSGNLTEACVTFGNAAGRSFCKPSYYFGDGQLSTDGNADVGYWPGTSTANSVESGFGECIYSSGTKNRGGDFSGGNNFLKISDRSDIQVSTLRVSYQGGRGVYNVPATFVVL